MGTKEENRLVTVTLNFKSNEIKVNGVYVGSISRNNSGYYIGS
jgi:hypothetical protein